MRRIDDDDDDDDDNNDELVLPLYKSLLLSPTASAEVVRERSRVGKV